MNHEERRIFSLFQQMNLPLNEMAFDSFSNKEKQRLERLVERMQYLHNRLINHCAPTLRKFTLEKDEYRALEWIMQEMELLNENEQIDFDFDRAKLFYGTGM